MKSVTNLIKFIVASGYALFLTLSNRRPRRIVLYYHSIPDDSRNNFQRQIRFLAARFRVVKPSTITTETSASNERLVAVTFDDGFVSVGRNAVPVLKDAGFDAALFIPTGLIGGKPAWAMPEDCQDRHETVMDASEIVQLDRAGFEIASHTISHPRLTDLPIDRIEQELAESKETLENLLGYEVTAVSYPHGAFDSDISAAAAKIGYRVGFTTEPRAVSPSTSPLEIGRFTVSPYDSVTKLRVIAAGGYQASLLLSRIKKKLRAPFRGQALGADAEMQTGN